MDANCSNNSRSVAATSTGVGVACALLWGLEGVESVLICDSWEKNEDIEGRRPRGLEVILMLCSTRDMSDLLWDCVGRRSA
jgi:hypothetical protein